MGLHDRDYMRVLRPWRTRTSIAEDPWDQDMDADALLKLLATLMLTASVVPTATPLGIQWMTTNASIQTGFDWAGLVHASPLIGIGVLATLAVGHRLLRAVLIAALVRQPPEPGPPEPWFAV